MARDPGSTWKPLPEAGAPDGYAKTQFIVHSTGTMASAAANYNYFLRDNVVVESTFIVGWGPEDPTLQIMDSTDNADANGSANRRGISVEVVGDGAGGYNAWQVKELIRLGLWARKVHGIVPRVIPSEPSGGFGWHVMFGAPGPWTSVNGKVCPGARRIQELKSTVFPAIFGGTATTIQEDDMPLNDADIGKIWMAATFDPVTGKASKTIDLLKAAVSHAYAGRVAAEQAKAIAEASAKTGGSLSDADIARIRDEVGAEVAENLSEGYELTVTPKIDPA